MKIDSDGITLNGKAFIDDHLFATTISSRKVLDFIYFFVEKLMSFLHLMNAFVIGLTLHHYISQ